MDAVTVTQYDPHANETYGALCEGVHIAGYSFERACGKLEWLLEADRWRGVGDGFDDVNGFLASIKLDAFRPLAEQRRRVALRIKELQPKVSNKAIAKALGAGSSTIDRDVAPDGASVRKKPSSVNAKQKATAPNGAPDDKKLVTSRAQNHRVAEMRQHQR